MPKKPNLDWSAVEKALAEGTFSGYKMGVLETRKIFRNLLEEKNIPGRDLDAKIKYLSHFLSQKEKLNYATQITKKIIYEPYFEISREETKKIISAYWQAMSDAEEAITTLTKKEKIILRVRYYLNIIAKKIKIIAITILAFSFFIYFLSSTSIGRKIAQWIVKINIFFIFKILLWTGISLIILFIIYGIYYLMTRGKDKF